jgi:sortase A
MSLMRLLRKNILNIILVLFFLTGLLVMLYPHISNYLHTRRHVTAVRDYIASVGGYSEDFFEELLDAAHEYNASLLRKSNRFTFSEEDREEYSDLLSISGSRMIGVLEIDKIDVNLPIYHGTSDNVLQMGAGHYEGSSLPVGGRSTHTVITGHTGLPSSMLLTNLDQMEIGDTFVLRVLNQVLTYQIDQLVIVEPTQLNALAIVSGMDYATLATCTPYGINSHRIFARGVRISNAEAQVISRNRAASNELSRSTVALATMLVMIPAAAAMALQLLIRLLWIYRRRSL